VPQVYFVRGLPIVPEVGRYRS